MFQFMMSVTVIGPLTCPGSSSPVSTSSQYRGSSPRRDSCAYVSSMRSISSGVYWWRS